MVAKTDWVDGNTVTAATMNTLGGEVNARVPTSGALGTPSSGNLGNCTGLPVAGIAASTTTGLGVGSIEIGAATDTTVSRISAGDIAVENNRIYRAGGADVPITDGGTGVSTLPSGLLKGAGTAPISAAAAGTDFVAPGGALGTPSSGNLGNCTGLPASGIPDGVRTVNVSTGTETRPVTTGVVMWIGGSTQPVNYDGSKDIWFGIA